MYKGEGGSAGGCPKPGGACRSLNTFLEMADIVMERVFSGAQPTGNLHLGNYLGAIRNWVALQKDFECIFCVVDLHAITVWQEPNELRSNIRELAASMSPSGLAPNTLALFYHCHVSADAVLSWMLNCIARITWPHPMTHS